MNIKGKTMNKYKHWRYYLSKLKSGKRRKTNCPICQKMILELLYYKWVTVRDNYNNLLLNINFKIVFNRNVYITLNFILFNI